LSIHLSNTTPPAPGGQALVTFQADGEGNISAAYVPGSGGGGTVTHTGALASGQILEGNGGADIKVGDLSGDVATSGSLATTIQANAVTTSKINNAAVTEAKIGLSNNTTNDVSISQHGFAPKAPNDATKFLDGTGAYSTPPNSGGTVTHTGTLNSGQLLKGNGGADITVGDLSGDVATSGSLATTIQANAVTTSKINNAAVTEAKIGLSNNTTNDVSTTQHGFAPKAPNSATVYLDGTGNYSTPVGTGTSAANLVTAGQGYVIGGGLDISRILWNGSGTTAGQLTDSTNRVYCVQFVIPYTIKISTIKWLEGTTNASQHYSLGIYDAAGTTRLVTTGSITGAGASLTQKSVSITPVTLTAGVYWFAFTADATGLITIEGMPFTSTSQFLAMFNNTNTYFGVSGNAATAGVLPSSLGTITAQNTAPTSVAIPIVMFAV